QVEQARQRQAAHTQLLALAPALALALTGALTLALGALRVIDGRLTVGGLAAVQALMLSFIAPIQSLVNLGGEIHEAQAGLARLDDALRSPIDPALAEPPAAIDPAPLSGRLAVSGLSFGYSRLEPPLLSEIDLAVEPGRRVAIVGGSGSGKSTLARLIAGLHQPWSGEIRFDGKLRGEIAPAALRQAVALVEQEPFLFAGSLRDNLTLWDPAIGDAALLAAAEDAGIAELLAGGGLDRPVEEGGRNFSGGQRQRLELARALARNPRLLILDEATNALDPIVERRIGQALLRRGSACLVIAHRLNTVRDCDEIIVLDQGRIVQRGRHDELISQPGLYAQLIEAA
ncbi:MAG TPA: ATP-binding cassette domain-containing protein, partial [Herpetosiphonaceae bacterium]